MTALEQYPEKIAVVRLGPGAEVPTWAESSSVFSITATAAETSLVCAARSVPKKAPQTGPFHAFAVATPLEGSHSDALLDLLAPLREVEVEATALSTFETVWILVPVERAQDAADEWRRRGYDVRPATPA